ncbi:hypothetical protein OHA98_18585 [Streptomyces sp. NBC_00654]|uniref:hypothetical protein n=1 Tax=Streptomyces sp. NBC_00654 TaxID=2975799 RepID=UPI00224D9262|nr:hypothetical protein [Streptomyces sp. NBC_00654]MCX4966808.1 hypothetical protein [Streptomyces sp. NBC_00654]
MTVPVRAGPGLLLEKSADDTRMYRAGDEVTYTYTVAHTGNTAWPMSGSPTISSRT